MTLHLTNPHAVLAALQRRPQDVLELRLPAGHATDAWAEASRLAARHGIVVVEARGAPAQRRGAQARAGAGGRGSRVEAGGRGSRAEARVRELPGCKPSQLWAAARRAEGKGLWLALDCVQDPRNVGAVFRSAAFFGVAGVLLTRDRSAPLSAVAYDAASGGLEHVPFAWATNLDRDLAAAQQAGLWILGAAETAEADIGSVDRERSWLLVVGSEEKGLRRLTRDRCDQLCRLTPRGEVGTLNVSVAAAVLMAALCRGE